jgi:predicted ATPase
VLIERDRFLAGLSAMADETLNGAGGRLVFLGGEAGIGKSALAAVFADSAAERMSVRRGGCDNLATPAALGPLFDAVPELSDLIENEAGLNRLRLFRRLRAVLSAEPTLLLLEDVHWADEATLEMLRYLDRRLVGLPLLVLATFRDDEVSASHPLTMILGDLATSPGVARMSLPPLTVGGVQQLVERAGSALDPERVHSNTGGWRRVWTWRWPTMHTSMRHAPTPTSARSGSRTGTSRTPTGPCVRASPTAKTVTSTRGRCT